MKNLQALLAECNITLTAEQLTQLEAGINENYKTRPDYDKQVNKLTAMTQARDDIQAQLTAANEALDKFADIDPDKIATEIQHYKDAAAQAQADADARILQRDQRDWLLAKLGADGYNVTSVRVRDSLIRDIMDADNGLKWRDGKFLGLDDFMKSEKEADPSIYLTNEEREAAAAAEKAKSGAPRFTSKDDDNKGGSADNKPKPVPAIW